MTKLAETVHAFRLRRSSTTKATDHELQEYDNFTRYGQHRQMGRDHQRAFWSTSQCADDPTLCHAVHLPLTVGHPLGVICVVSCVRGQFPVYPSQPTYRRAQVPSVRGIM